MSHELNQTSKAEAAEIHEKEHAAGENGWNLVELQDKKAFNSKDSIAERVAESQKQIEEARKRVDAIGSKIQEIGKKHPELFEQYRWLIEKKASQGNEPAYEQLQKKFSK